MIKLKLIHEDPDNEEMIKVLEKLCGEMSVTRRKRYEYLVNNLEFSKAEE